MRIYGGGKALRVSPAASLSGKYKFVHANDIQGQYPELFVHAIRGDYADEKRWISRDDFYEWLRNINRPVFVSEYSMPDDFVCIAKIEKRVLLPNNSGGRKKAVEKIFIHKDKLNKLNKTRTWKQLTLFDNERL